MDARILENAGFSRGEIAVYLALLKLGSSRVSSIAQETGLHRTNIYDTLEKLKEKGLVSYVLKDHKKFYAASDPERIIDYLKEREQEIQSLMPHLHGLMTLPRSDSLVEVFKGKEGIKSVLKDVMKERKDYVVLEEKGYIQDILPHFYPAFNKQMDELKIKVKILTNDIEKIDRRKLMSVRTLPTFLPFPSATLVYGNKVAILIWDEPYHAILIKSKQVADSYRNFFNVLWKQAV